MPAPSLPEPARDPDAEIESLVARCIDAMDPEAELEKHTVGRPEVKARALRLLDRILAAGASAGQDAPLQVGPYRILSRLGEGGMGEVFLAERKDLRQRVAIKVIKPGMDSRAIVARFEAERQALARMEHSNIAKVLDAGVTPEGRPYFVMEYVKGIPITRYSDENRLSVEERLRLFQQVCSGVQHAHSKGVIHRDLTPNNVLVTVQEGKPTAKIIDFGLARATDHRLTERPVLTEQGVIMGTPEYMSPEQAGLSGLDIDTRTDVYTLGVMLYELLSGELPFSREELRVAGYEGMCRTIREKEPERPSTRITRGGTAKVASLRRTEGERLLKRLRGDLDWVVLKCLEKDRTRRYETPTHLADDLQRHLDDEVVTARAPSAGYRLRKLARRYRGQLFAAGVVLAAVIAGLVGTTAFWWEARLQARLADARAKDADAQRLMAVGEREAKEAALAATQAALARATGLRLLALATQQVNEDPGCAVALAAAAAARVDGPETERALRLTLCASREVATRYLWEEGGEVDQSAMVATADLGVVARMDHPVTGTITVWSLRGTLPARRELPAGDGEAAPATPRRLALSPDGGLLAVAGREAVSVHRTDSAAVVRRVPRNGREVSALTFDSTNTRLVIAWRTGAVSIASIATDQDESHLDAGFTDVTGMASAGGAARVLVYSRARGAVFDLSRRERVGLFEAEVQAGLLSADGTRALAWDGWTRGVSRWDEKVGALTESDPSQRVLSAADCWAASPDGRLLALGCGLGVVKIWRPGTDRTPEVVETRDGDASAMAFDPGAGRLALGASNGVVRVLDCKTWRDTARLVGHVGRVAFIRFVGESGLISVAMDGTERHWNLANAAGRRPATASELHGLLDVFSPADGSIVEDVKGTVLRPAASDPGAVFREMGIIRDTGDPVVQIKWMAWPAVFAPDGRRVAFYRLAGGTRVTRLLTAPDLSEVRTVAMHMPAFSPDGRRLVGSTRDGPSVVDLDAPATTALAEAAPYLWPRFAPDGRRAFAIGRSVAARSRESTTVRIWDATTGRIVSTCEAGEPLLAAAMSPDGSLVAAGGAEGNVWIFEAETGRRVASLPGHRTKVYAVAFAPGGRLLASGGRDGAVRMWDVVGRVEVGRIVRADDSVLAVGFSADGAWVTFGSLGGTVAAEPVDPRAFVAAHGLRALTPAEWARFEIGGDDEHAAYRDAWRVRVGLGGDR